MDEQIMQPERPASPVRRKRSKKQIFKEVYLPVIIVGIAAVLVLIFIIGSIVRGVQKGQILKEASIAASESLAAVQAAEAEEAARLIDEANALANGYDYMGAIQVLDSFSGDATAYPELTQLRDEFMQMKETMVVWNDPNQVVNLSFQLLIADPDRAFADSTYGNSFKRNFITTSEFSTILQQLYENDYILVRLEDFVTTQCSDDGTENYVPKDMYLPSGKKPLMLTQTNVNYNLYLVDSDNDMIADKDGLGFASKLVMHNGSVAAEIVNADGLTSTGNYDLIPILDEFVAKHPDFSFRGAKATIALTGYNGLFGYRTNNEAKEALGEDAYNAACASAKEIADNLEGNGYTLACYTYNNTSYGQGSVTEIQADLNKWNGEVVPVLGGMNTLVYAQNSDISTEAGYSGEKFDMLHDAGFDYYLGFCENGTPWVELGSNYVRQGRILVSGSALENNPSWFDGMFDASTVLSGARN